MNIIFCADDRDGLLFGGRRQSRDRAVIADIADLTRGGRLLMSRYSDKMFAGYGQRDHMTFEDTAAMLRAAEDGDFCFLEEACPPEFRARTERIVIYRWNRRYPSDEKIGEEFLKGRVLRESFDFAGNSHEKITREIYE